jgi:hypothetical protein
MTSPSPWLAAQETRVVAAADLCGRAGARQFQIGYLHEDVPAHEAGWFAHAQFRGARITAEDHSSPGDAAEALALKLLTGARCACGKLVQLTPGGALAFRRPRMADGTTWTAEEAAAAGQCRWRRVGPRWYKGCGDVPAAADAFTRPAGHP